MLVQQLLPAQQLVLLKRQVRIGSTTAEGCGGKQIPLHQLRGREGPARRALKHTLPIRASTALAGRQSRS